jgi:O-antigen ligase
MDSRIEPVTTRGRADRLPAALWLVSAHVLGVASLGGYYAKIKVPVGGVELYPTELVLLLSLVLAASAMRSFVWDNITKVVIAFVALGSAWILVGGVGGDLRTAGAKAYSFFVYSGFYFVIRACACTHERRMRLLRVFAIAAFAGVALGVWEYEFGEGFPTSTGSLRWLSGEFAIYSLFAAMIAAVPAILERRLSQSSALVLGAATAELILAQHRSGFVAFAVALGATAVLLGGSTRALQGVIKVVAIAVIGVTIFTLLFGSGYVDETITRIGETTDFSDGTVAWRLLSWYEVGSGVIDQPWGHGFAHWDFTFNVSDPLLGSHNALLDLTYRIGVPGLVLFIAMPTRLIAGARRLVRRDGAPRHVMLVTTCACMLAFLVFASFNMALEAPYMSVMFWVILGIGAGELSEGETQCAAK